MEHNGVRKVHDPLDRERERQLLSNVLPEKVSFIERWALWILLLIFFLTIVGAWFINYPDVVQADAYLMAINTPKEVVVRQEGTLIRLFVHNEDTVVKGQTIGWIESSAGHEDVLRLAELLEQGAQSLSTKNFEKVAALFNRRFDSLGDLQVPYQQFTSALLQFDDYLVDGFYFKKRRTYSGDLNLLKSVHGSIENQLEVARKDLDLASESMNADSGLYQQKVISKEDIRVQRSKVLNKQSLVFQLEASLTSNESMQMAKKADIDELAHATSVQEDIFSQAIATLESYVENWKKKYLITSPSSGKIVFLSPIQEKQFFPTGKIIGYVNPYASYYYAQIFLQQNNFGKIQIGQSVQLRVNAYPYQEFGFVDGKLNFISNIPSDSGYIANVALPNGLITNYKRSIQYRSGLRSEALIITRKANLLQRLGYGLKKALLR